MMKPTTHVWQWIMSLTLLAHQKVPHLLSLYKVSIGHQLFFSISVTCSLFPQFPQLYKLSTHLCWEWCTEMSPLSSLSWEHHLKCYWLTSDGLLPAAPMVSPQTSQAPTWATSESSPVTCDSYQSLTSVWRMKVHTRWLLPTLLVWTVVQLSSVLKVT